MERLTTQQQEDARRLKSIYEAKKRKLGLSQVSIAEDLGKSQSAIAHWLNGKLPLNAKAVAAFARILQVKAADISPSIAREFTEQAATISSAMTAEDYARRVMVVESVNTDENGAITSSVGLDGWLTIDDGNAQAFALEVKGNGLWPRIKSGEFIVIEKGTKIQAGDDVYIVLKNKQRLLKTLCPSRTTDVQVSDIAGKQTLPQVIYRQDVKDMWYISAIIKPTRFTPFEE